MRSTCEWRRRRPAVISWAERVWYNIGMTTGKMIGRLKALKKSVLADGRVDWDETEQTVEVLP